MLLQDDLELVMMQQGRGDRVGKASATVIGKKKVNKLGKSQMLSKAERKAKTAGYRKNRNNLTSVPTGGKIGAKAVQSYMKTGNKAAFNVLKSAQQRELVNRK